MQLLSSNLKMFNIAVNQYQNDGQELVALVVEWNMATINKCFLGFLIEQKAHINSKDRLLSMITKTAAVTNASAGIVINLCAGIEREQG